MNIDTTYYERCINTLDKAHSLLLKVNEGNIDFDIYHSACAKTFEIVLEQSGKLLKEILKPFFHTSKEADRLVFKDIFRHAALRSFITNEAAERWMVYRDNRNNTAHDYGVNLLKIPCNLYNKRCFDGIKELFSSSLKNNHHRVK